MKKKILSVFLVFVMLFTQNGSALAQAMEQNTPEIPEQEQTTSQGTTAPQTSVVQEPEEDPAADQSQGQEQDQSQEITPQNTPAQPSPSPTPSAQDPAAKEQDNTAPSPAAKETITPAAAVPQSTDNDVQIISEPQNIEAGAGQTVTFSTDVQANKPEEVTYQWQKTTTNALSASDSSTAQAIKSRQEEIKSVENDEIEKPEDGKAPSPEEKQEILNELKNTPITPNTEGWEDIPGANTTSLSLTVTKDMAENATAFRMVATTKDAAIATGAAYVSNTTQFDGGDGSEKYPFLISSYAQLCNMHAYKTTGTHFKLTQHITAPADNQWIPVGGESNEEDVKNEFNGTFNGNGYTISNLRIK